MPKPTGKKPSLISEKSLSKKALVSALFPGPQLPRIVINTAVVVKFSSAKFCGH